MNQVRRLQRALGEVQRMDVGALGDDELVEIEPGVWGRPHDGSPLGAALEGLDRFVNAAERVRDVVRGRHVYGAAARKGRR